MARNRNRLFMDIMDCLLLEILKNKLVKIFDRNGLNDASLRYR